MTARPRAFTLARVLETVLAATALAQRGRGFTVPQTPIPETENELVPILRENLHAASQHVAMGHDAASFRDCGHPACQDAANLIPELEVMEEGATDAELDRIFDRVQAALEAGAFADGMSAAGENSSPSLMLR